MALSVNWKARLALKTIGGEPIGSLSRGHRVEVPEAGRLVFLLTRSQALQGLADLVELDKLLARGLG